MVGHHRKDRLSAVFSPGFLHRAGGGGGGGGGTRCTVYSAVSLLCAVLLANGEQQTDNGRRRTVVHWNVPLIIRLPRHVIVDLVLASCHKAIRARRLRAIPLLSRLDCEHMAPRVIYSYVHGVRINNGRTGLHYTQLASLPKQLHYK